MAPASDPTAAAAAKASPCSRAMKKATGPDVSGSPTSQPLTLWPHRRPARLATAIRIGVTTTLRTSVSIGMEGGADGRIPSKSLDRQRPRVLPLRPRPDGRQAPRRLHPLGSDAAGARRSSAAVEDLVAELLQPERGVVRAALGRLREPDVDHAADEHRVIALLHSLLQRALDVCRRVGEDRRAGAP